LAFFCPLHPDQRGPVNRQDFQEAARIGRREPTAGATGLLAVEETIASLGGGETAIRSRMLVP
jgi:hypothetical protein